MISKVAVAASAVALLACPASQGGGIVDETNEQKYTVGANPTVTVRNTDGRVYVYASDDNEITVKAYKRAFTKERLSQIEAKISQVDNAITIDTEIPPPPKGLLADRSGTVEYTLLVPQRCAVKVEQSQGEIEVEGLRGPTLECRLTNGRMTMQNCFGPAQISLGTGGIDVGYTWWENLPFAVSLDVGKGDVALLFPPPAALRLDAATQSGHIRNVFVEKKEDAEDVQQLKTEIGGVSAAAFKIRTDNGNIKIGKAY